MNGMNGMTATFTDIEITEILNMAFGRSVRGARINNEKDGQFCRKVEGMLELKDEIDYMLACKTSEKIRERETMNKEIVKALKGDRQC